MKIQRSLVIAIVFGLVVASGLVWQTMSARNLRRERESGRAPETIWYKQPTRAYDQNAGGTFSIKTILITPQEMLAFYALQTTPQGIPTATALSCQPGPAPCIPITVYEVQALGVLDTYAVGVIHMA